MIKDRIPYCPVRGSGVSDFLLKDRCLSLQQPFILV